MRFLRTSIWTITIIYWLLLFIVTHIPQHRVPQTPITDKTAHCIACFTLGCLLGAAMWITNPARRGTGLWVLLIGLTYGGVDEVTQRWVNRFSDFDDWIADAIGIMVAVTFIYLLRLARSALADVSPGAQRD